MLKAKSASQPSTKLDTIGFLRDEGDSDKMEPTQREVVNLILQTQNCFLMFPPISNLISSTNSVSLTYSGKLPGW